MIRRRLVVGRGATVVALAFASPFAPPLSPPLSQGVEALDKWIVVHFRHAQLLPAPDDSTRVPAAAPLARIESIRSGRATDTIFALNFDATAGPAALASGASVRLVGTTGTTTPVTGRVIARRAFRAPTVPPRAGATSSGAASASMTRHGWAYLVVVPRSAGEKGTPAYRGWYLQPVESRR